ncbi:MAG: hypothetical protein ABI983_03500 [Acidobacteriota bacterium]
MSRRDISEQNQDAALHAYRAAACAEADAHFDDRALEAQRHKILARLEHLGHPAKVIRFPKAGQSESPVMNIHRRWISVAAAAGLIIGLLGGQLVHLVPQQNRRSPMAASIAPSASIAPAGPKIVPVSTAVDDRFLEEVDLAMQVRGSAELRALDEFTPFSNR